MPKDAGNTGGTPEIELACQTCRGTIVLSAVDVRTTRPIRCTSCDTDRLLSYREFLHLEERIAEVHLKDRKA